MSEPSRSPIIIPVVHNVSSIQRVVDSARLAYSLGFKMVVVTKAYGGAAQSGVAEASKIALKQGRSLLVLPDLPDAIELLNPDTVILLSADYAKERVSPENLPVAGGRIMVVASGGEPDFSPAELRLGRPVYFDGVAGRLGTVAELALALYYLRGRVKEGDGESE